MKENFELFSLTLAAVFGFMGFGFLYTANKRKYSKAPSVVFFIIAALLLIPGWDYFYTSGFWQRPQETKLVNKSPESQPILKATPEEIAQLEEREKQEAEEAKEANSPEHLKKIEDDKIFAKQDCDLAKNDYENNLREFDLSQDVTLRLESSVDSNEFVTVDIYITYNSFEFESRKELRDQTKNIIGTFLLKYLTIHFPKSHISANLHENDLNPNWDK
jgi:hypothetical protein